VPKLDDKFTITLVNTVFINITENPQANFKPESTASPTVNALVTQVLLMVTTTTCTVPVAVVNRLSH
jgi:hypothetical protein